MGYLVMATLLSLIFGLVYPAGALFYYKVVQHDKRSLMEIYKEL